MGGDKFAKGFKVNVINLGLSLFFLVPWVTLGKDLFIGVNQDPMFDGREGIEAQQSSGPANWLCLHACHIKVAAVEGSNSPQYKVIYYNDH